MPARRRHRPKQSVDGLRLRQCRPYPQFIQWVVLLGTLLIGLRHILPGEGSRGGSFDSFCAFGGVETLLPHLFTGSMLKSTNLLNFSVLLGKVVDSAGVRGLDLAHGDLVLLQEVDLLLHDLIPVLQRRDERLLSGQLFAECLVFGFERRFVWFAADQREQGRDAEEADSNRG